MNTTALARRMALGIASDKELEGADLSELATARRAIAGRLRVFEAPRLKAVTGTDGSLSAEYVFSDETPDRYGDVVSVGGWELDEYRTNPTVLFQHSAWDVVGRTETVAPGTIDGRRALLGTIKFAAKGTSPTVDMVRALVEQDMLRAVSVGFNIVDAQVPDPDLRETLGVGKGGLWVTRSRLLEVSLVSIPANPKALERALAGLNLPPEVLAAAQAVPTTRELLHRTAGVLRFGAQGSTLDADPDQEPQDGAGPDPLALMVARLDQATERIESLVSRVERSVEAYEAREAPGSDDSIATADTAELVERLRARADRTLSRLRSGIKP